jgi:dTDP-4-amino-4,6-dideoxygalactose transaminase
VRVDSLPREHVPFVDLAAVHEPLREELLRAIGAVIESGAFTNGPAVTSFEHRFAAYCGTASCVGLSSGLDALRVALLATSIEPGSHVLVPAMTFVATFEAVSQADAVPVPVDVCEQDYCLDAAAAAAALTARTSAIMPVHLYGQMADMRTLAGLATRAGIALVEDACQAHGAWRDGLRPGAASHAAAFSFYPGKNLGAVGDAGALVTNDETLARRATALRDHGQTAKYRHELVGYTARLDTIQAAVLIRKLAFLDAWNAGRRSVADLYLNALDGVGDLVLPDVPDGSTPVWHLFVVRTAYRSRLSDFLAAGGIETGRHYPQPPHLTPAYVSLGHGRGAFPVAERLAREGMSLPIYPGMRPAQAEYVVDRIRTFFAHG